MRDWQIHLTVLFDKRHREGGRLLLFIFFSTFKVKRKDGVPHRKLFKKMRTSRKLAWCKRDFLVRSQGLGEENRYLLVKEIPPGVLSGCSWDALFASSDGSS